MPFLEKTEDLEKEGEAKKDHRGSSASALEKTYIGQRQGYSGGPQRTQLRPSTANDQL